MAENLTKEEIDERIAVLRRFKKLLEEQRNKFKEYLFVLENQQDKIETEDADALYAHTRLEEQIVSSISNLQKVIVPMQKLYDSFPQNSSVSKNNEDTTEVKKIQFDLAELRKQVLAQNEKNRNLLKIHIGNVREKLSELSAQNPYRGRRSVYAERPHSGTMITIEA